MANIELIQYGYHIKETVTRKSSILQTIDKEMSNETRNTGAVTNLQAAQCIFERILICIHRERVIPIDTLMPLILDPVARYWTAQVNQFRSLKKKTGDLCIQLTKCGFILVQ